MSYGFTVRGATAALALAAVATELDRVVEQQPIHAADRGGAEAAAKAMVEALAAEPGENDEVVVTVNGYVSWRGVMGDPDNPPIVWQTNVNVTAKVSAKLSNPAAPKIA